MNSPRAVLLLAALLSFWNLWGTDVWAPDEPYFAEGAREMIADGHWAVPHVNGAVTTDKPPLFFWLIALLSVPLGKVTSLSARLASALAALGSVALTMRLGRRLAGPETGVLAGLVLATTYLPWDKARSAQIEALLCFLILAALSAFEAFRSGGATGRRAGLLFWLAMALAVLAKGPVGLLLPLGIALATLALDGELRRWSRFAPFSGPLLFALVVGIWAVVATRAGAGDYSVWGALRKHAIERALHGLHHAQPPWYYLEVLPPQLLPWSLLAPGALLAAWRRRSSPPARFLLTWAAFVVLFFTLSTEKRDLYVLPAYPALALLIAGFLTALAGRGGAGAALVAAPGRRWATIPFALTGVLLAGAGLALPIAAAHAERSLLGPAATLGAVLAIGGAAMALSARAGRLEVPARTTAAAACATYLVAASVLFPALDPRISARAFALEVKKVTAASRSAGEPVLALGLSNLPEALAFFSDGVYFRETSDPRALAEHLARDAEVYAVADAARLAALPPSIRGRIFVVRSAELSRRKVVLISNHPPAGSRLPEPGSS